MTVKFRSLFVLVVGALLAVGCADRGLEPAEGFVEVTGGRAWYRIVGSGTETPVLLLHGGPGASSAYFEPLAALSRGADLLVELFASPLGLDRRLLGKQARAHVERGLRKVQRVLVTALFLI